MLSFGVNLFILSTEVTTIMIKIFQTLSFEQSVLTKIKAVPEKHSDQSPHYFTFHLHLMQAFI